jgi:hypothetical protein
MAAIGPLKRRNRSSDPGVGSDAEAWALILREGVVKRFLDGVEMGSYELTLVDCCCPKPQTPQAATSMFSLQDYNSELYVPLTFLADSITEPTINSRENILLDETLDLDEVSRYQILGGSEGF